MPYNVNILTTYCNYLNKFVHFKYRIIWSLFIFIRTSQYLHLIFSIFFTISSIRCFEFYQRNYFLVFQERNLNLNWESNSGPLVFQTSMQTITPSRFKYQDKLKSLSYLMITYTLWLSNFHCNLSVCGMYLKIISHLY